MFLFLLFSVPVTFTIGTFPVIGLLWGQLSDALVASKADAYIQQIWWTRTYSWAFGGPFGRYLVGTTLGLRVLKERPQNSPSYCAIEVPQIKMQLTAIVACVISVFSVVRPVPFYSISRD